MGFLRQMKEKAREEIDAYRNRRRMEKDPAIVKAMLKEAKERHAQESEYRKDKEELRQLRNSVGLRGSINRGFGAVKEHLANVKKEQALLNRKSGKGYKLQNPREAERPMGGVMNSNVQGRGMHSDLPGAPGIHDSPGRSPALNGTVSRGGVFAQGGGRSPVLGDKKKPRGGIFN